MIERVRNGAANGAVWKGNIRSPLVESPSGNNRIFAFSFSFLLISKTSNDTWFFLWRLMKIVPISVIHWPITGNFLNSLSVDKHHWENAA